LECIKSFLDLAYHAVAIVAAIVAIWVYYRNRKLEQSKWASNLYEKFYETDRYKKVRDILDSDDSEEISILVRKESAEFTDYLNFFEQVAIFTASKQLDKNDVEALFCYYFNCLELRAVRDYIDEESKGYEKLKTFLDTRKK
jgi:predicted negative regulator of RcsB-dependent stress response